MQQHHHDHDGHFGGDGWGDGGFPGLDSDDFNACRLDPWNLGLGRSIPGFITLADAIIAHPDNGIAVAGRDGATDATSNLYWIYTPGGGLDVAASAGYLNTQTGNGGFNLEVRPDGSWSLSFDGSNKVIGHDADDGSATSPPPAAGLNEVTIPGTGAASFDASALPPSLINGGLGWDTIQGGVGDYMIGGSGTAGGGVAGDGNCAVYSSSPGSVLVDMQNGFGYGGNADGDTYVNMNQARGSLFSNVLIGNVNGTDLKSGGNDSLLISTGGNGFELRPDGTGNVLVSTVGGDRVVFDSSHGWDLGDANIMLGFNLSHGTSLDLTAITHGSVINLINGTSIESDFHTTSAAGYNAATGTGDINDYVKIIDEADGSHVLFSATGQVQTAGTELIDLKFTHGLNVSSMYANHQILA
jgi:hypothetical protein